MARAKALMGSGFSAGQANGICERGAVTATGSSSQANGKLLSYAVNDVTTASGADSVVLPTVAQGSQPGDFVTVTVETSTTGKLYPGGSETINGSTSAVDVAQHKTAFLVRSSSTNWGLTITA